MTAHRAMPLRAASPASRPRAMNAAEWAMLLGLSMIWGASFYFNKVLLGIFEPFTVVIERAGIAAVALVAAVYLGGDRLPARWAAWRSLIILSLFNNVAPFVLILWGQKHIAGGLAAILNATTPLFAAIMAHLLAGERLTAHRLAGVVIGMAGVALMVGPDLVAEGLGGDVVSQLAVLAAAASYGFAAIYGRRLVDARMAPTTVAAGQLTVTTLIALPVVLIFDQPWLAPAPTLGIWAAVVAIGLGSTALGYFLYFRLIAGAGGVNASLVTLLVPVSALMLGWLLLDEALTLRQAAGMAVILLGLVVTDGRAVAAARRGLRR
ncbi:MAG: DMT family transporter [Rhodospirillaceae bacterium]|nr:DMT family transporter [Rhodospirillaceae bacterium]